MPEETTNQPENNPETTPVEPQTPQQAQQTQIQQSSSAKPVWKVVVAVIIDIIASFFILGYIIAAISGQTTAEGFNLQGGPAIIFFALFAAYFYFGYKVWKKSLGQYIMGIAKK